MRKILAIIETDPILREDYIPDNNNITSMVMIHFMMKIFKLVIIILNISYFLGFLWFIFCETLMIIHDLNNNHQF